MNYELFEKLRHKFDFEKKPEDIFASVVGYDGIKKIINTSLISEKTIAICIAGPPATGKSKILKCIENHYGDHAVWFDCSNKMLTPAGLRDFMYEHKNMKILLMNELSRMSPVNQEILLELIAEGSITNTKSMAGYKHVEFKGLKIYATSNNPEKLIPPVTSRFDIFHVPPYTYEQFRTIGMTNYKGFEDPDFLINAIDAVWHILRSKDMRDLDKLMNYAMTTKVDLEEYIHTKLQYSKRNARRTE